jgi:hypothetical protein
MTRPEAGSNLETFRPRPGTTVAFCGTSAAAAGHYRAAYLRQHPGVATMVVADDDRGHPESRAAQLERADQVVLLHHGEGLRWPGAWAVAYATAAGKPIWWLRQPVHGCPVCCGHAVALVAAGLAWCVSCGWVGDDTAAATVGDDAELDAGSLLEVAGNTERVPDPLAARARAEPPTAPPRFSGHADQAASGGSHLGRRRWLR